MRLATECAHVMRMLSTRGLTRQSVGMLRSSARFRGRLWLPAPARPPLREVMTPVCIARSWVGTDLVTSKRAKGVLLNAWDGGSNTYYVGSYE